MKVLGYPTPFTVRNKPFTVHRQEGRQANNAYGPNLAADEELGRVVYDVGHRERTEPWDEIKRSSLW